MTTFLPRSTQLLRAGAVVITVLTSTLCTEVLAQPIIFEQGGDAPQTLADAQELGCLLENVSEIHGDLPTFTDVDVYHSLPSDTTALVVWNPVYERNGAGGFHGSDLGLLLSTGEYEWTDTAISDPRPHLVALLGSGVSAYLALGPDELSLVGEPPSAFVSNGDGQDLIGEYELHQRVFGLQSLYQLDDSEDQLCVGDAEMVPSALEADGYRYYQNTGFGGSGPAPATAALHFDLADIPDSLRSRFSIKVRTHVPSQYFLTMLDGTPLIDDEEENGGCGDPYVTDNSLWCDYGPALTYDEIISLLPSGETELVLFVGGGVTVTGDEPPGCVSRAISGAANTRGVMVVMPILAFTSWAGQPEVASSGGNTLVRFSVRAENQIERYQVELFDATTGALLGPGESRALWRINGGGHTYQVTVPVEIPAGTQVRVVITPHGRTTYYENQPIEADVLETVTAVTVAAEPPALPSSLNLTTPSPNPSRHRATARLTVPSPQPVRAMIYNVLGREVQHVFEGMLAAGEHELRLNTTGLPAGVYVLQVIGETGTATQRFTVVR